MDQLARHIEHQVEAIIAARSRAGQRPAANGEWSSSEVLAHVAEFIPYWADQAAAVAARERDGEPFGRTHDDPGREAAVREHADDPAEIAEARVRAAAAAGISALRRIPASGWDRTGRHARRGEMDVRQLVQQFLVAHLDEHVEQARQAAA